MDFFLLESIFECTNKPVDTSNLKSNHLIIDDEELKQMSHDLIAESILCSLNEHEEKLRKFETPMKALNEHTKYEKIFRLVLNSNRNKGSNFDNEFYISLFCFYEQIECLFSHYRRFVSFRNKINSQKQCSVLIQCFIENLCLIMDQNFISNNIEYKYGPQLISCILCSDPNDNIIDLIKSLATHLINDSKKLSEIFWEMLLFIRSMLEECFLIDTSYYQPTRVLIDLIKLNISNTTPLLNLIIDHESFNLESLNGQQIENDSFFGPLIGLKVINSNNDPNVSSIDLNSNHLMDQSSLVINVRSNIIDLKTHLHELFYTILISPSKRMKVLIHLAKILEKNSTKANIQFDRSKLSSDILLINLNNLFLMLFEKVDITKIDINYPFYSSKLVDYSKYTAINSTSEEIDQFISSSITTPDEIRFPTSCFFMTYHSHHVSLLPAFRRLSELNHMLQEINAAIIQLSNKASKGQLSLPEKLFAKQLEQRLIVTNNAKFSIKVLVCSDEVLRSSLKFYAKASNWIVDLFQKHPKTLSFMPEYFIEDIAEFTLFIVSQKPLILYECDQILNESIATLILTCIINHKYIKNPYLIAKLVEIMYALNPTLHKYLKFYNFIVDNEIADNHLTISILLYYIDLETLGTSTGFYDKFGIRHNLSVIMRLLWSLPSHKNKLISFCINDIKVSVSFINLLVNDLTYLIDESLVTLRKIHSIQIEMDSPNLFANTQEQINSRQEQVHTLQRQCNSYIRLTNETLKMLNYLSEGLKSLFIRPELVDRMAVLLDYCIIQLTGPSYMELKVKEPEKYEFDPKLWLNLIIGVFLHLESPQLTNSMANDERSFSLENFDRCFKVIEKISMISIYDIEKFRSLVKKAHEIQTSNKIDFPEEEIPDEFKDPLMNILMKDPVILPNSGIIVDRSVISRHLLNSSTDPFSRMPLTIDEVIPENDLRVKIHNWIETRINTNKNIKN